MELPQLQRADNRAFRFSNRLIHNNKIAPTCIASEGILVVSESHKREFFAVWSVSAGL